ncbi:proprotein convertase P-domain-containing protein [Spirosoma aerophilum]
MFQWLLALWLLSSSSGYAQRFFAQGGAITEYSGIHRIDSFPIVVRGLSTIASDSIGITKVCLDIFHPRVSDLKVQLLSPDGTSIWLTNRNGGDVGRHYRNTCFRQNGFSGYIHEAKAPFEGEFTPDGRFSFLHNGQNPNGIWYLLIEDLKAGEAGALNYVQLEFDKLPSNSRNTEPCAFESAAGCGCPDGRRQCELLPDLIILPRFTQTQIKEYARNDPNYPGQLRFAVSIANIGDGPMETLGKREWFCNGHLVDSALKCPDGSYARQKLYQRIYRKAGDTLTWTDRTAGTNYYDSKPGHDHYHVDDWVEFRLVKLTPAKDGKTKRTLISKGRKVSFCLFDSGICQSRDSLCAYRNQVYGEKTLINYGMGNYTDCKAQKQGISVGGYDTYGMLYEGQFINLPKGLASGTYQFEVEIDPGRIYREKDRTNNLFTMLVTIAHQQ